MVYYTMYISGYCKDKTHGACYTVVYSNGKMIAEDGVSFSQSVTQNRCNLAAVLIGLKMIPNNVKVIIVSDDEYTIKSVMGINKRIHNLDILEAIDDEIEKKKSCEYRWLDRTKEKDRMVMKYCENACNDKCNKAMQTDLFDYKPYKANNVINEKMTLEEILETIDSIGRELGTIKKYIKNEINKKEQNY